MRVSRALRAGLTASLAVALSTLAGAPAPPPPDPRTPPPPPRRPPRGLRRRDGPDPRRGPAGRGRGCPAGLPARLRGRAGADVRRPAARPGRTSGRAAAQRQPARRQLEPRRRQRRPHPARRLVLVHPPGTRDVRDQLPRRLRRHRHARGEADGPEPGPHARRRRHVLADPRARRRAVPARRRHHPDAAAPSRRPGPAGVRGPRPHAPGARARPGPRLDHRRAEHRRPEGPGLLRWPAPPAGQSVFRVRQEAVTSGANAIGWYPSFPTAITVGGSARPAQAPAGREAAAAEAAPAADLAPEARAAGAVASSRYRWSPTLWDFTWEEGQSLARRPRRGRVVRVAGRTGAAAPAGSPP